MDISVHRGPENPGAVNAAGRPADVRAHPLSSQRVVAASFCLNEVQN